MKRIFIFLLILAPLFAHAQSSYIVEQLGRDEHQIVQSLGAFVGNEHAESQAFDITFMPAGASVQGVMIINTADYRCTFRMEKKSNECVKVELIVRSADFLRDFQQLFRFYPTTGDEQTRHMAFGDKKLLIQETGDTRRALPRTYVITVEE